VQRDAAVENLQKLSHTWIAGSQGTLRVCTNNEKPEKLGQKQGSLRELWVEKKEMS